MTAAPSPRPSAARIRRGARNFAAGLAAEDAVARHYERRGATVAHRRWRGGGAEVDLIAREGGTVVFVEDQKFSITTYSISFYSSLQTFTEVDI